MWTLCKINTVWVLWLWSFCRLHSFLKSCIWKFVIIFLLSIEFVCLHWTESISDHRFNSFETEITLFFFILFSPTGSHNGWNLPCIFVLTTDKKTKTYAKMFNAIKSRLPGFMPHQINCDFELAAIKAAKKVFPESKIQGCYFHLSQSIVRNLNNQNLKIRYERDLVFASEIRQMQAVAFLPVNKVWISI